MSSHERFGYEWDTYSWVSANYEGQFKNWTAPFSSSDWKGKYILDVGCGMGRNTYWPMKWGASRAVAFDFDERSVARAKMTLKDFSGVSVLYKSVYDMDWKDEFDVAFSIGVIHHLHEPKLAVKNMVTALRPEGVLLLWVYGYEGNEWIVKYVDPVRMHITSRLPVSVVHVLSYLCSAPLYLFVKLFHGLNGYLTQLSTFDFWHVHSIVFDQLIPDVAHYWKKDEVEALVEGLPLRDVSVTSPPNGSGWILTGVRV